MALPAQVCFNRFAITPPFPSPYILPPHHTQNTLFVCHRCFRYFDTFAFYKIHINLCPLNHPPGTKLYQSNQTSIWKVKGADQKLYCQCLCLFGKLFIDHKYIFFDVNGFDFYLITQSFHSNNSPIDLVLGFFSKEILSYDAYNLACIVTFPPYQNQGHGALMIEFSYHLDRIHSSISNLPDHPSDLQTENIDLFGTPERPLSEQGAKGYLHFWTSTLVRFFSQILSSQSHSQQQQQQDHHHPNSVTLTLEQICRATRLRPNDAAFALISSGLTQFNLHHLNHLNHDHDHDDPASSSSSSSSTIVDHHHVNLHHTFLITKQLIDQVIITFNVNLKPLLDPKCFLF